MSARSILKLIFTIILFIFIFIIYKPIAYIVKNLSCKKYYKFTKNLDKRNVTQQQANLNVKSENSYLNKSKTISINDNKYNQKSLNYVNATNKYTNVDQHKTFYDYLINDDFYSNFVKQNVFKKEQEKPYYKASSPYIIQKSVTKRIDQISQPKNGYVPIKLFQSNQMLDGLDTVGYETSEESNLLSKYMGTVVDYISRYMFSKNIYNSFSKTIYGVKSYMCLDGGTYPLLSKLNIYELIELYNDFKIKINSIKNLKFNDFSKENLDIIRNAFILVQADDILWRIDEPYGLFKKVNNKYEFVFKYNYEIPDYVCKNTLICIQRTVNFYKSLKNIVFSEVFVNSEIITHSDCDFISDDTVWDLKVTSLDINSNYKAKFWSLQILIYYLMLKDKNHHNYNKYSKVKNIGLFNPFTNTSYTLNVDLIIDKEFIREIKDEIIGFNWKPEYGLRIDKPSMVKYMKDLLRSNDLNIEIFSREFK